MSTVVFWTTSTAGETTTVDIKSNLMKSIQKLTEATRLWFDHEKCGPSLCHIIYSMLLAQHACLIIAVGEIKEKKSDKGTFKSCIVRVRTQEKRDDITNEIIRESGDFDAEVSLNDVEKHKQLQALTKDDTFVPCTFILRSFTYTEKNVEKLGKQLQLKRWWR